MHPPVRRTKECSEKQLGLSLSVLQKMLPLAHPQKCFYKHLFYGLDSRLDLHFQALEA